jgi:hypothetical protein
MLYRLLPRNVRKAAVEAYRRFRQDPTHPGLRFHRLATDPQLWSVRITRDYRAVGLVYQTTITWFWIGNHQAFDKTFPR